MMLTQMTARTQAPPKQIPKTTHHSLHLFAHPGRRKNPHQAREKDEEERRSD
jgi:hypothetical protein